MKLTDLNRLPKNLLLVAAASMIMCTACRIDENGIMTYSYNSQSNIRPAQLTNPNQIDTGYITDNKILHRAYTTKALTRIINNRGEITVNYGEYDHENINQPVYYQLFTREGDTVLYNKQNAQIVRNLSLENRDRKYIKTR